MFYMGIDQSYSHTGIVVIDEYDTIRFVHSVMTSNDATKFYPNYILDLKATEAYQTGLIDSNAQITKKRKDLTKPELELLKVPYKDRFKYITNTISNIIVNLESFEDEITCGIENISLFSKGAVVDLARLLGAIECTLQSHNLQHQLYPPTVVKKFAGKGNAGKDEMIAFVPIADRAILEMKCPKDKNQKLIGLDNLVDAYWIAKLTKSLLEPKF